MIHEDDIPNYNLSGRRIDHSAATQVVEEDDDVFAQNQTRGIDPSAATQVIDEGDVPNFNMAGRTGKRIDHSAATQVVGEDDVPNYSVVGANGRIDPTAATQVVDEDHSGDSNDTDDEDTRKRADYPRIDPSAATQVVDEDESGDTRDDEATRDQKPSRVVDSSAATQMVDEDDIVYTRQGGDEDTRHRKRSKIDHSAATQVVDDDDILSMVDASLEQFGESNSYLFISIILPIPPFFPIPLLSSLYTLPSFLFCSRSVFYDTLKKSYTARLICDFKSAAKG